MSDITPKQVLDLFLFEDVLNNRNHYEDEWDISYVGDSYVLIEHATGKLYNIDVVLKEGTLTNDEIMQVVEEQEWEAVEEDIVRD